MGRSGPELLSLPFGHGRRVFVRVPLLRLREGPIKSLAGSRAASGFPAYPSNPLIRMLQAHQHLRPFDARPIETETRQKCSCPSQLSRRPVASGGQSKGSRVAGKILLCERLGTLRERVF